MRNAQNLKRLRQEQGYISRITLRLNMQLLGAAARLGQGGAFFTQAWEQNQRNRDHNHE